MNESQLLDRLRQLAAEASQESGIDMALRHIADLELAIEHRTELGQATGILMERYDLDSDDAFQLLVRLSNQTNTKLYDLAADVVKHRREGKLPQP